MDSDGTNSDEVIMVGGEYGIYEKISPLDSPNVDLESGTITPLGVKSLSLKGSINPGSSRLIRTSSINPGSSSNPFLNVPDSDSDSSSTGSDSSVASSEQQQSQEPVPLELWRLPTHFEKSLDDSDISVKSEDKRAYRTAVEALVMKGMRLHHGMDVIFCTSFIPTHHNLIQCLIY